METLRENDFLRKNGNGEDEVAAAHLVCIPISPGAYELTRKTVVLWITFRRCRRK